METLTVQQQIVILRGLDLEQMTQNSEGLCITIVLSIYREFNKLINTSHVGKYIPLFTHENAKKFGAGIYRNDPFKSVEASYWWPRGVEGHAQRTLFVEWMIDQLKKQLENNPTKD